MHGLGQPFDRLEIFQDLPAMPGASLRLGAAASFGFHVHCELFLRSVITVPRLAGAHRVVTGAIEDGGDRVLLELGWAMAGGVGS